jgi:ubiquitin C-terminal hydrolase
MNGVKNTNGTSDLCASFNSNLKDPLITAGDSTTSGSTKSSSSETGSSDGSLSQLPGSEHSFVCVEPNEETKGKIKEAETRYYQACFQHSKNERTWFTFVARFKSGRDVQKRLDELNNLRGPYQDFYQQQGISLGGKDTSSISLQDFNFSNIKTQISEKKPRSFFNFFSCEIPPFFSYSSSNKIDSTIASQGLVNSGVDCYLNSALQCLRSCVDALPEESKKKIIASLHSEQNNSSLLPSFLEKKFDGRDQRLAAALRIEIRNIMLKVNCNDIVNSIDPSTGKSKSQCDASEALSALMAHLDLPRVSFKEKDTYLSGGKKGQERTINEPQENRMQDGELILPMDITGGRSIQGVINQDISYDITGDNGIKEGDEKYDIHKEKSLLNPPDVITISLKRFSTKKDAKGKFVASKLSNPISGITNPITFPTYHDGKNSRKTTYTPISIICHSGQSCVNSGHYITYRKEGDQWFCVNDGEVKKVKLNSFFSFLVHRRFLKENAYVISYRKVS